MRDLSTQLTALVHQEVALAKAEVGEKTKKVGVGAGFFGVTAVIVVLALGTLVTAAVAALIGKGEIQQGTPPVPQEAVESTKEDVAWLKTQAQSAKP